MNTAQREENSLPSALRFPDALRPLLPLPLPLSPALPSNPLSLLRSPYLPCSLSPAPPQKTPPLPVSILPEDPLSPAPPALSTPYTLSCSTFSWSISKGMYR